MKINRKLFFSVRALLVLAGSGLAFFFVILFILGSIMTYTGPTPWNVPTEMEWKQVERGMSEAEVIAILGSVSSGEQTGHYRYAEYGYTAYEYFSPHEKSWTVFYDSEGKVVKKRRPILP